MESLDGRMATWILGLCAILVSYELNGCLGNTTEVGNEDATSTKVHLITTTSTNEESSTDSSTPNKTTSTTTPTPFPSTRNTTKPTITSQHSTPTNNSASTTPTTSTSTTLSSPNLSLPSSETSSTTPTVRSQSTTTVVIPTSSAGGSTQQIAIGVGVGVGLGVGGFLILAAVVLLIVCCRRRGKCEAPFNENIKSDRQDRPIKVNVFLDHVTNHQSHITAYKIEFESLPGSQKDGKSVSRATDPQNSHLNRYINILPFNDTLVPLYKSDEQLGYINASFIDGYKTKKCFIATQAPLVDSLADFWQMIWEHECGRIIMVTNLFECGRAKCDKYWPNVPDSEIHGAIRVDAIAERTYGDYILRTFRIEKDPTSREKHYATKKSIKSTFSSADKDELRERRIVYQFHFTTWPDQGVPNTCTSLLKLYRHAFKEPLADCKDGPVVIHCSAGVGRTGTLIALDISLEQSKDQGTLDVPKCIDRMRRQRMYMVQTVEQYIFIHHVLLEALILEKVEIPCSQFEPFYKQLAEPGLPDGLSRLQREMKVLEALKPQFERSHFEVARKNQEKNRSPNILPADVFIPYIRDESDQTDVYVNAVYVPGYQKKTDDEDGQEVSQYSYITTQSPMQNTIEDFWTMIRETGSSTIVMLNELEGVERYWPEDGRTVTYGKFSITNMGEISSEDIRMTHLQVTVAQKSQVGIQMDPSTKEHEYANSSLRRSNRYDANTFDIRHFRLLTWPDSMPKESTLVSLYTEVVNCQERKPDRPVVVHCLHGVERTGVFCGLMNVLDVIRLECEVDVFNAVKRIHRTRPEFIQDLSQYKYLYDVAMEQIRTIEKVDYVNGSIRTLILKTSN